MPCPLELLKPLQEFIEEVKASLAYIEACPGKLVRRCRGLSRGVAGLLYSLSHVRSAASLQH